MFTKLINLEQKRRDAIINAAFKEFASKGFDDASTNVIAKESGTSKGLLFHYIISKKDFFLFLFDYSNQILNEEYYDLINFSERDILERFRQAYLVKIDVIHKYPYIFEFLRIALLSETDEIKKELDKKKQVGESAGFDLMFEGIDETKFREGLDIERCKKLIYWSILGYSMNLLGELQSQEISKLDFEKIRIEFDSYLVELRKSFYK